MNPGSLSSPDRRRPRDSERGQSTLLVALCLSLVMLGFLAFAVDIGYLFQKKRMAQSAADAAALAAAEEESYPGDSGNEQAAANAAATLNGFNTSATTNPAVVSLTYPTTGNYSDQGSATNPGWWVQAKVTEPVPTFFMAAFRSSFATMSVSATAVASGGETSPTCVCLEGSTSSSVDLNINNGATFTASGCGVSVDSPSSQAVEVSGAKNFCANYLGVASTTWSQSSEISSGDMCSSTKVVTGVQVSCNPTMPAAPTVPSCVNDPTNGGQYGTYTVGPTSSSGTVCYNSLDVGSNGGTVTLNPGIYVINGGNLHFFSGGNKGGNGVFFYLENGASVTFDNGANNLNLVAGGSLESDGKTTTPSLGTSGLYNGILFYQAATDTNAISIQGGSSVYFYGSVYAPGAAVTFGNGSSTGYNGDIVAQSLTVNGGATVNSSAVTNLGTLNETVAKITQ